MVSSSPRRRRRIINFTRANTGGIVLDRTIFDIKAVLHHIIRQHERLSGEKRCEFNIAALPDEINGDAVLIEQALGIVIANAMRYSTEKIVVEGHLCGAKSALSLRMVVSRSRATTCPL